ncbi:MAG: hypothetical protein A3C55_03490 [Gammaproteobacteria bacterium RIFCSPHIGHO2_02_FULL_42_13]|nr:MAG: hypothetical protein A3C55_03490 [Gammaproteobacteria bacterium RIFCSPHIGHO2_02_FULL_42_13]OGT70473.1 MAG: hypothetical protein A3H43_00090 [Gammaproteobacteria bacterium RIFCSPLOWO2_02_FULL_42_9]
MFSIVLLFSLIALAMGCLVLLKSKKYAKQEVRYCVWSGYFIVIVSFIIFFFSIYQGYRMYSYQMQAHAMMMQGQAQPQDNTVPMKAVRQGKRG